MSNVIKKEELAHLLADKTGFYIKNMRDVADALAEIVMESLQSATFEEDSELHLAPGIVIVGKRKSECECLDPRNGEKIISPEKIIPSAVFKQSVRKKLRVQQKARKKK